MKDMKIDTKFTGYLAGVAAIDMGEEELEAQRRDLERIVSFTGRLSDLDTEGLPCQTHPFGDSGGNRLRADEITNEDHTKELIAAAPDSKGPYIRVPRTVEE